jgi:hypothetical protein
MYRCVAKTSGAKAFLVHCIFLRNAQQNTAVAEDPTEPSFQKVYPKLPEVKVDKNFELPLSQISQPGGVPEFWGSARTRFSVLEVTRPHPFLGQYTAVPAMRAAWKSRLVEYE